MKRPIASTFVCIWNNVVVDLMLGVVVLLLLCFLRSGGIQGGISNGENIVLRVAFKPTSTIGIKQQTVTRAGEWTECV